MYGLVNRAIEDLISRDYGPERWTAIRERAGCDTELFLSMESYPDKVTYDLVGAASEELQLSAAELLEAVGRHWVRYTSKQGYGDMFQMWGESLREFLANLDVMHARVQAGMPQLRPPVFKTRDTPEGHVVLEYHSERAGLSPMVVGLLHGLVEHFGNSIEVEHCSKADEKQEHEEFLVRGC